MTRQDSTRAATEARDVFLSRKGIDHSVEVAAASLYEAAGLAVAKFRQCEFHGLHIGPGTVLRVAVKQPETVHEVRFGKVEEEHASKVRVRQSLGKGR